MATTLVGLLATVWQALLALAFGIIGVLAYLYSGRVNSLSDAQRLRVLRLLLLTIVSTIVVSVAVVLVAALRDAPQAATQTKAAGSSDGSTPTRAPSPVPTAKSAIQASPTAFSKDSVTLAFGSRHVRLTAGEVIAGTADRFQADVDAAGQPPCTAFLIEGPIETDLRMLYGGWEHWVNAYDEGLLTYLLQLKTRELQQHATCPSRGINIIRWSSTENTVAMLSPIASPASPGATAPRPTIAPTLTTIVSRSPVATATVPIAAPSGISLANTGPVRAIPAGQTRPAGTLVVVRRVDNGMRTIDIEAVVLDRLTLFGKTGLLAVDGWEGYSSIASARLEACGQAQGDQRSAQTAGTWNEGYQVAFQDSKVPERCE